MMLDLQNPDQSDWHFAVEAPPGKVSVVIPDLFSSFLSLPPRVNPLYLKVKAESEAWFSEKLGANRNVSRKIQKLDFAWFCSIAAPEANKEELRTLCDWGNWVFPFDDTFDNGDLRSDEIIGRQVLNSLLSVMRDCRTQADTHSEKTVLVEIHDTIWERVVKSSQPYVQQRFAVAMELYCEGIIAHVGHFFQHKIPSLEEYMAVRRRGVGVLPVFALMEYAHNIKIPENIYNSTAMRELRRIGIDVVLIQNDILSYAKEQEEGVPHNLVTVFRTNGMSIQDAFDQAGEMLKHCYRDWYLAQAELLQYGEAIDAQLQLYMIAIQNVMTASLNWHFKSTRYFGDKNDSVRRYRRITVLEDP
ncbi:putative pentalenene synthase [Mollisia scopiformis]|uniref:Terpene synthase n=1 Tax=Mollisia scopiformis TaxID=149040 RepID=A0A194WT55_MOLSC|nr:putative pentalenene synthase [Mollisia scopiformis]KUJ11138.1 putative pentalenene synthase [Mollisia scopiformis]